MNRKTRGIEKKIEDIVHMISWYTRRNRASGSRVICRYSKSEKPVGRGTIGNEAFEKSSRKFRFIKFSKPVEKAQGENPQSQRPIIERILAKEFKSFIR